MDIKKRRDLAAFLFSGLLLSSLILFFLTIIFAMTSVYDPVMINLAVAAYIFLFFLFSSIANLLFRLYMLVAKEERLNFYEIGGAALIATCLFIMNSWYGPYPGWVFKSLHYPLDPIVITPGPTRSNWDLLSYSENAINRQDWEAAYRLLEDGLVHTDETLRVNSHELLVRHPKILDGAKESFSEQSIRKTLTVHADSANELEEKRLAIYKTVATPADYADAERNFLRVFSEEKSGGVYLSD